MALKVRVQGFDACIRSRARSIQCVEGKKHLNR